MLTKRCSHCRQIKPVTEFYKDKSRKDGYLSRCKSCRADLQRIYQEKYPQKFRDYANKYSLRNKIASLTYYGNGKLACVICGESRLACLTIDHINGGGYRERKKKLYPVSGFYRWLRRQGYPLGYQTLCMNCQFVKKAEYEEAKKVNWDTFRDGLLQDPEVRKEYNRLQPEFEAKRKALKNKQEAE